VQKEFFKYLSANTFYDFLNVMISEKGSMTNIILKIILFCCQTNIFMPKQGFLFQYFSNLFIVAYPIDSLIHSNSINWKSRH